MPPNGMLFALARAVNEAHELAASYGRICSPSSQEAQLRSSLTEVYLVQLWPFCGVAGQPASTAQL